MKGGDLARYNLEKFSALKEGLLETAVSAIKALGFCSFLDINMYKLPDQRFSIWTTSNYKPAKLHNEDVLVFTLDPEHPRVLTRHALTMPCGLPMGKQEQDVPQDLLECPDVAVRSALRAAHGEGQNLSMHDAVKASKDAAEKNDHMLQARIFIAAVFNFAIFTTSSNYFTPENMATVSNIKNLVTTDWCRELLDHMMNCLKTFHQSWRVHNAVSFVVSIFEIFSFLRTACCMTNSI